MAPDNFFTFLINGVIAIAQAVISRLPLHTDWGIGAVITAFLTSGPIVILAWIGSFINLTWMGVIVGAILLLEIVRGVIALWRLILRLIPAAA